MLRNNCSKTTSLTHTSSGSTLSCASMLDILPVDHIRHVSGFVHNILVLFYPSCYESPRVVFGLRPQEELDRLKIWDLLVVQHSIVDES